MLSWLEQDPSILQRLLDKLSNSRQEFATPTADLIDLTTPQVLPETPITRYICRSVDLDAEEEMPVQPQQSAIVELVDDKYVMSELEIVELLDSEEDSSTTEPLVG